MTRMGVTIDTSDQKVVKALQSMTKQERGTVVETMLQAFLRLGGVVPPLTPQQAGLLEQEDRRCPILTYWSADLDGSVHVVFLSGERWTVAPDGDIADCYTPNWRVA